MCIGVSPSTSVSASTIFPGDFCTCMCKCSLTLPEGVMLVMLVLSVDKGEVMTLLGVLVAAITASVPFIIAQAGVGEEVKEEIEEARDSVDTDAEEAMGEEVAVSMCPL
jgi:ABC-type sulfate transport system permease component